MLAAFLLFTFINLLTAQYGRIPEEFSSLMVLVNGPLALSVWGGEIFLGILLPTVILALNRAGWTWGLVAASAAVIVGMFFARYDFVVAGQLVPMVGREELWEYLPSLVEIVTVVTGATLGLFLYSVGNRVLPLADADRDQGQTVAAGVTGEADPAIR